MTSTAVERAEFLEARRAGIGGSDVAAIAGLDPWKTAIDVYQEKLGLVPDVDPTPDMQRGRYLEDVAVQLYGEHTGRAVRRQPMSRHRTHDFMIANLDRQIIWPVDHLADDIRRNDGPGVLEAKVPRLQVFQRIKLEGLRDAYILQLQHYLGVRGYKWGSFAILNPDSWGFITFDVAFDEAMFANLVELEGKFWNDHVLAKVPPPEPAGALIKMPEVTGGILTKRDDPEFATAVALLREAKHLKKTGETLEEQAKARMKGVLGGFAVAEGAGARVYFRQQSRDSFDRKALEGAGPLDPMRVAQLLNELLPDKGTWKTAMDILASKGRLDLDKFMKTTVYEELRYYALRDKED